MIQNDYLAQMGIERWCLQGKSDSNDAQNLSNHLPSMVENAYCYWLGKADGTKRGLLLADASAKHTKEVELTRAIAEATRCVQKAAGFLSELSLGDLRGAFQVVILLGPRVASAWLGSVLLDSGHNATASRARLTEEEGACTVILTHSPQQLLENKQLKAEVWQDLQYAMEILS